DSFQSIASVRTGCFKSYVIDQEGQEQVLGFYLPGEIIGLDAIHSHSHTANVVALDTSAVCGLTFESMSSMARQMPELQSEMFCIMSRRINELETIAGDLSADERIAMFLMSLSRRFASRGYSECEFILAMSRRDIASYLRLATETVSRVLARFQKAGILKVDRKQVSILNLEELQKLAGQA
ncbi:MAG TPA: helix-turn-helix domain-containing protein, partial [Xanthomonadales bacterium]|nr:helix-turn-helix domain-containing protein [Xanthomonadales bacterium]